MDVIFLNGPSSSGKSSIARELQDILDDNYLHIGIDSFIAMMPERTNNLGDSLKLKEADGFYWCEECVGDSNVYRISSGVYAKAVNDAYRTTVSHLVKSGLKVIVDDVTDGYSEFDVWRQVLREHDCLYVGVFCLDKVLSDRERNRGDRKVGSAIEQSKRVHEGITYDISVNSGENSVRECAEIIRKHIAST